MVELKECANPNCSAKFKPYNSRQKVCARRDCKNWLTEKNGYQKKKFRTPLGEIVTLDQLTEVKDGNSVG